jgi:NAD(P)-dependent dehydrogenase (short-subunit alcohol dehydrogenase family)
VAVVTGGTDGIGAAICKALTQGGAAVAVGYNSSPEKAEAMLSELPGGGHMALCMPATDSAALKDPIATVDKRHPDSTFLSTPPASRVSCRMATLLGLTTRSSAASSTSMCEA